jgi:hypothetical protein
MTKHDETDLPQANTTSAVRNRAMGHRRGDIFDKYYTNPTIALDTVSAYLGTPSRDWIVRSATHMGLTMDPHAQRMVINPTAKQLRADPEVSLHYRAVQEQCQKLLSKYVSMQQANSAKHDPEVARYQQLQRTLEAVEVKRRREIYSERWNAHFEQLGTREIRRQRTQQDFKVPARSIILVEERAELAPMMCRNDDVDQLSSAAVRARRCRAMSLLSLLSKRRVASPIGTDKTAQSAVEGTMDALPAEEFDLYDAHLCPWCVHDAALPSNQRRFTYARAQDLRTHIERAHMHGSGAVVAATVSPFEVHIQPPDPFPCPYSFCGQAFATEEFLKNHLALEHQFFCAPSAANAFDRMLD